MPSAGESSLWFAVSSSTAGPGVTPEHSRGLVSSRRHAGRGDPRSASVVDAQSEHPSRRRRDGKADSDDAGNARRRH
jgi:hypothetical protein